MLEISGLRAGYGPAEVLRGIDLVVRAGEIVAVLGANGAGKTTLNRAISGVIGVRAGSIRFGDEEIAGSKPAAIVTRGLIHVPEGRRIFPNMSVRDNLIMGSYARAKRNRARNLERVFATFPRLAERTRQYYDRYRLPVMHTKTNRTNLFAVEWLWKEWMNLLRLREDGVPIIGFTWYGLVDMKDWDSALTRPRGHVNKVGLYSLDRRERKVAKEFRKLVNTYAHLPISSTKFLILTA